MTLAPVEVRRAEIAKQPTTAVVAVTGQGEERLRQLPSREISLYPPGHGAPHTS